MHILDTPAPIYWSYAAPDLIHLALTFPGGTAMVSRKNWNNLNVLGHRKGASVGVAMVQKIAQKNLAQESAEAGANEVVTSTALHEMKRADVIGKFRRNQKDVGSPEVQIALLTKRLDSLSGHFKNNQNDRHSQRGMMRLISRRKGLLQYLKNTSPERYKTLIGELGLRK